MKRAPSITSPYAPDLGHLRAWLEARIAALQFVEIVVAILALVTRLRDLNAELVKQVTLMRRARPRSETLARLEHQMVLAFGAMYPLHRPGPSTGRLEVAGYRA